MTEQIEIIEKGCLELEKLLTEAREEAAYYQNIAKESGKKRLREIHELSTLITRLKRSEETLRESEEKYRNLVDLSPDPIAIIQDDRHQLINPAFTALFGYPQRDVDNDLSVFKLLKEEDKAEARRRMENRFSGKEVLPKRHILDLMSKDGKIFTCETSAALIRYNGRPADLVIIRDITDRIKAQEEKEKLEERLLQAKKMEAIATLAGGIAHEFNNALFTVTGSIELLQMDVLNNEGVKKYAETMKASAHRMANLTDKLLAYAEGGKYQSKIISLSNYIEDTLPFLKCTIDPSIRVETDLPRNIPKVKADLTQMQLVLSAVILNASEAIEREGRIRILVKEEKIGEDYAKEHPGFKPGKYICLIVEDNGKGMDEKTRSRIFEPFFTTKFQGRGLGMAAAYGIIRNHDGWISVDSVLGKGTEVRIYLPAIEAVVEGEKLQRYPQN